MWYALRAANWLVSDPLSFWRTGDLTRPVSHCVYGSPGNVSLAEVVGGGGGALTMGGGIRRLLLVGASDFFCRYAQTGNIKHFE